MENQSIIVWIILLLTALANAVSSIIAWIAKIGWSKEYREAKDEIIRAKEAEIRTLKEYIAIVEKLNPQSLKQWLQNGLEMAQTYVSQVNVQLEEAQKKIKVLETDKLNNRDLYEKANNAFNALKVEHEKLKTAVTHGSLPTWGTVVNSVAISGVLATTTSTQPPPIRGELMKHFNYFRTDKACPKCMAQMFVNRETGDYFCEECGYQGK
jgi:hypothetical protein